jgi:DNA-binding response OmpR family regulator
MNLKTRVLVVDDRHSLVWFIEHVLQGEGFDVLTAFGGQEGLQKAQEEKPDLIILDTVMPKMDGYEVYRNLQADPNTARIPVLFLTLWGEEDKRRIMASGGRNSAIYSKGQAAGYQAAALDFLAKPVAAKEVVERVKALLQSSKLKAISEEVVSSRAHVSKPRILIVDDDRSLVWIARSTLQKAGFDVMTAFDGLEGLRKAQKEKPDLIILDIILPEFNGFQVLELLRQRSSVPVIMLTGMSEVDSAKKTLALGADDYLVKPVTTKDLLACVRDKLQHAESGVT